MRTAKRLRKEYKEIVHELFVLATELGEKAHDTAAEGQDWRVKTSQLSANAKQLIELAENLKSVAKAIDVAIQIRLK